MVTSKKKYHRIQTKLELSFATIALTIAVIVVISLFAITRSQMRQDVRKRLGDVVGVAALQIDADLQSTLIDPSQENGEDYIKIKKNL